MATPSGTYPYPQGGCTLGYGVVYIAPWGDALYFAPQPDAYLYDQGVPAHPDWRDVGEVAALTIDLRTERKALPRYDGAGGEQCAVETFLGADLTLTLDALSTANLAQAYAGTLTNLPLPAIPNQQSWGFNWGNHWGNNPLAPISQGLALHRINALTRAYRAPVSLLYVGRSAADNSGLRIFIPKLKLGLARRRPIITGELDTITLQATVLHDAHRANYSPWWDEFYTT